MTKMNMISYTLFALSAAILFSTVYFLFNIKVIEDWKLTLPAGDIHAGDTIVVQSTYHKLRDVSGESVRYLECKNEQGTWIRYELNRATSNRAKGKGGTGIALTMRRDVADVPTTCKIDVNIRYDVLPFRHVYANNSTKEFTLLTEVTPESSSNVPQATTQKSPSPAAPALPVVSSSYNHGTTISQSSQPITSLGQQTGEPDASTQPVQDNPGIVGILARPIINLLGGLF